MPDTNFFELVRKNGFPNRFRRFCCRELKEFKILDKCIMGVRKSESVKRNLRYSEPTECRFYGRSKKEHVEGIYPILDWTDQDVVEFIEDRGIKLHPLYYRADGSIDPKQRLGCMCCPLQYHKKLQAKFKQYPRMVRLYLKNLQAWADAHPESKTLEANHGIYGWFFREVFLHKSGEWETLLAANPNPDFKKFLEEFFEIDLTLPSSSRT